MSTTATTTQFPPGIYRIVVAGGALESQRLTNGEGYVTILPPSVDNDPQQEVIHYFHDELDCLSLTSPLLSGELKAKMTP
jgi:hypothetical protein